MAFPFTKHERMATCFHDCFEVMAFDDALGVEPEFRELFRTIVVYYKRFWLDEIGPEMICQWDEANRTNNHSEAFHRGIGRAVQVAHPQTLVLVQLLVNIEEYSMLRFGEQRLGKSVKRKNKRFDELEKSLSSLMKSFDNGLFKNDVEYLSSVSKVYVEYNHILKEERVRHNTDILERVIGVKDAVMKALNEQNKVIVGDEQFASGSNEEEQGFVDVDFKSEILFDSFAAPTGEERNAPVSLGPTFCAWSGVPLEECSDGDISDKRRDVTKPRRESVKGQRTEESVRERTLRQRTRGRN